MRKTPVTYLWKGRKENFGGGGEEHPKCYLCKGRDLEGRPQAYLWKSRKTKEEVLRVHSLNSNYTTGLMTLLEVQDVGLEERSPTLRLHQVYIAIPIHSPSFLMVAWWFCFLHYWVLWVPTKLIVEPGRASTVAFESHCCLIPSIIPISFSPMPSAT